MGSIKRKPGDIFKIPINKSEVRFIQYLYTDNNFLGGDVIRAFNIIAGTNNEIPLESIIKSGTIFYTYTWILVGYKDGLWQRIGNTSIEDIEIPIVFRVFFTDLQDYQGEIFYPQKWYLKKGEKKSDVFDLNEDIKKYPIGMILPPFNILEWLKTGRYPLNNIE